MKNNENDNLIKSHYNHQVLSEAIADLSDNGKMAVYMHYHEGLSHDEIAFALDKTPVDVEDILERSQEYIIEETGNPEILNALSGFYIDDIKEKVQPQDVSGQVHEINNQNESNKSDNAKKKSIGTSRIDYKKIVLIAAALTIFASFVVLAMTFLLDDTPNDKKNDDDSVIPIEQNDDSKEKDSDTDDDINSDVNDANQLEGDGHSDDSDNSNAPSHPSGAAIQGKNGQIEFKGSDCNCGHVNPTSVSISGLTGHESHFRWEITNRGGQNSVGNGTGLKAGSAIKSLYKNKQDGKYLLVYKYEDDTGNIVWIKRPFIIDTTPISKNEYS